MGTKGKKALNIYQNPGIKNNPGKIVGPSIKGIGSPLHAEEKAAPAPAPSKPASGMDDSSFGK